jgi:hypothetical protein
MKSDLMPQGPAAREWSGTRRNGPAGPMTPGNAAAAKVRLIVWCKGCRHQAEPDVAGLADKHGADMPVPECLAGCGVRNAAAAMSILW